MTEDIEDDDNRQFEMVPIASLSPNPNNPRGKVTKEEVAELVESIKDHGILQPLLVRPGGEIIAGERRLLAAQIAGLEEVPVYYREIEEEGESSELALIENVQRRNLAPSQEARVYRRMKTRGMSTVAIAKLVGFSQTYVNQLLRILELPVSLQAAVDDGRLSIHSAHHLAVTCDEAKINGIVAAVKNGPLTGKQVKAFTEARAELDKPAPRVERVRPVDSPAKSINKVLDQLEGVRERLPYGDVFAPIRTSLEKAIEDLCAVASRLLDIEEAAHAERRAA